jgi:hypothetical protein
LEFTLPYSGEIKIDPKLLYPAEHFVVVLPKSMQFKAANPPSFESVKDPTQGDNTMEVAKETKPGQLLAFTLQGNGVINEPAESASSANQSQGVRDQPQDQPPDQPRPQGRDNRPGGGLGVPIDAPDALQQYRWPILGAFALLLAIGGWVVTKRQPVTSAAAATSTSASAKAGAPASSVAASAAPQARSSMLLEALKEELFQLEVEKKQGKITPEDYEKARAALDQTLDRALKRTG